MLKVTVALLVLVLFAAACGASHQPTPSSPASPQQQSEMPSMSAEKHENMAPTDTASGATSPQSEHEQTPSSPDSLQAEQAAYAQARPVFEQHCAACHTTAGAKAKPGALKHFNMDQYPFGGHHAADVAAEVREVLGLTGKEATMPKDKPGAVQGDQLSLVSAWADAFDRAHAAGAHANHAQTSDRPDHAH